MQLAELLDKMIESGAGDLHLQVGSAPMLRVGGQLQATNGAVMTDGMIRELMQEMACEDRDVLSPLG